MVDLALGGALGDGASGDVFASTFQGLCVRGLRVTRLLLCAVN